MLRINITPNGNKKLTSADFKNYKLPIPSKGIKEKKRATDDERKTALKGKRGAEASKINMKYRSEMFTDIFKKLINDYKESCK